MKSEIYQDGKLKLILESTDRSQCDIVVMPKLLVKECSMSAKGFDELFFKFLSENVSHTQAYEKAEQIHESYFERRRYSDYNSFRNSKTQRHNK